MNRWAIITATGEFKAGGTFEPTLPLTGTDGSGNPIYDPAYSVVDLPGETIPDRRRERYDATTPTKRRPATAQELATFDTADRSARFSATSRQKDVLATCALIVRAKNTAAWNAMTVAQKKSATLAEADVWMNIRDFAEDNL